MKFEDLIGSAFNESDFYREWDTQPIKLDKKNGVFLNLPSINELLALLQVHMENDGLFIRDSPQIYVSKAISRSERYQHKLCSISDAPAHYASGCTICTGDISQLSRTMRDLICSVDQVIGGHPATILTSYLSPVDSNGVLHFDRQHNFFVQREGQKDWLVSEIPAVPCPHDNLVYTGISQTELKQLEANGYRIKPPKDCGKLRFSLEPGDILYIPPGHYHVASTNDLPSLHYTITIEPDTLWQSAMRNLFDCMVRNTNVLHRDVRFIPKTSHAELLAEAIALFTASLETLKNQRSTK